MPVRRRTTAVAASLGLALGLALTACGDGNKAVKGTFVRTSHGPSSLYCVQLDDVNGTSDQDGRWYEVKRKDYDKASASRPGARLTFTPKDDDCEASSNGGSSSGGSHKKSRKGGSHKGRGGSKSRH